MKINLLKQIAIDCREYQSNAGWSVVTDIPEEFIGKKMKVVIEGYSFTETGDVKEIRHNFEVHAEYFLDEILDPIVTEVRNLMEEDTYCDYFEEHCILEVLELDTETMTILAEFGS